MVEEFDISKIAKEDILRILAEKEGKKSPLESVTLEVKVSNSFMLKAIKELEEEGLIQIEGDSAGLTKRGEDSSKSILEKHLIFEDYFRKTRNEGEAHEAAHILEHYVSREVIDNLKKLSTFEKEGIPLAEFEFNKDAIITDITFPDSTLFERIVSMGIVPGERIKITNKIGNIIIAAVGKKFALDEAIAQGIEVLEYGRT